MQNRYTFLRIPILLLRSGSHACKYLYRGEVNVNKIPIYPLLLSTPICLVVRRLASVAIFRASARMARDVGKPCASSLINDSLRAVVHTRACAIFPLYRRRRSTIIISSHLWAIAPRNPERPLSKIRKAAAQRRSWRAIKNRVRDRAAPIID